MLKYLSYALIKSVSIVAENADRRQISRQMTGCSNLIQSFNCIAQRHIFHYFKLLYEYHPGRRKIDNCHDGNFWRGKSILSIRLSDFSMKDKIASGVLSIGIPAALGNILMSVSQIITNSRMSGYGDMAAAAYGVSAKLFIFPLLLPLFSAWR